MSTTIDQLARMVADGFADTATKEELATFQTAVDDGFSDVKATLSRIENRLTHVDDTLLADYGVRIKRLEEALATPSRR